MTERLPSPASNAPMKTPAARLRRAAGLAALVPLLAGCATAIGPAAAPPARRPALPPPAPAAPMLSPAPEVDVRPVAAGAEPVALPDARGAFPVERRLEMRATAYCLRGTMRTGVRVRDGMAAGDPSVLPLGTVIRVSHPDGELVGIFVIMDTGGAIRGNKIDLWMSSCDDARAWGIRPVVAEVLDTGRA